MLPEPCALQFNHFKFRRSQKKWHTEPKRSVEHNKWLVFNNKDRMLKAITREISFKTINAIGRGI